MRDKHNYIQLCIYVLMCTVLSGLFNLHRCSDVIGLPLDLIASASNNTRSTTVLLSIVLLFHVLHHVPRLSLSLSLSLRDLRSKGSDMHVLGDTPGPADAPGPLAPIH